MKTEKWIVQSPDISRDVGVTDIIVGPKLGPQVALVYVDDYRDKKNAHLIAAAPEMYAALSEVYELNKRFIASADNFLTSNEADALEKVLAKARGES